MEPSAFIESEIDKIKMYHLSFEFRSLEEPVFFSVSSEVAHRISGLIRNLNQLEIEYIEFDTLDERMVNIRVSSIARFQRHEDFAIPAERFNKMRGIEKNEDGEDEPRYKAPIEVYTEDFPYPLKDFSATIDLIDLQVFRFGDEFSQGGFIAMLEEDYSYIPINRICCIDCVKFTQEDIENFGKETSEK